MHRVIPILLVLPFALARPQSAAAEDVAAPPPLARGFAVGLTGALEGWSLTSLEEAMAERHAALAAEGWSLEDPSLGWAPAFGGEISYRWESRWLVRVQGEWSRRSWSDRDGQSVRLLGGARQFVSVGTTTRVETNAVIASLGAGRVHPGESLAFTWTVAGVVAPLKVEDVVENTVDTDATDAKTVMEAKGIGFGGEAALAMDYPSQSAQTIYLEGFFRYGATEVEVEDPAWDSSFLPGRRKLEFTGFGLRLGLRWS
jgi:hypothetical protein